MSPSSSLPSLSTGQDLPMPGAGVLDRHSFCSHGSCCAGEDADIVTAGKQSWCCARDVLLSCTRHVSRERQGQGSWVSGVLLPWGRRQGLRVMQGSSVPACRTVSCRALLPDMGVRGQKSPLGTRSCCAPSVPWKLGTLSGRDPRGHLEGHSFNRPQPLSSTQGQDSGTV